MQMAKIIIVAVVLSLFVVAYFSFFKKNIISDISSTDMTEQEKITHFMDDCWSELYESGRDYVICCREEDKLYLCNNKRKYEEGDFVIVHVDLNKINDLFDPYYACGFSYLEEFKEVSEYKRDIMLSESYKTGTIFCTQKLNKKNYNILSFAGNINSNGHHTIPLIYVRIYLDGPYDSFQDFKHNINNSFTAIELDVVVN